MLPALLQGQEPTLILNIWTASRVILQVGVHRETGPTPTKWATGTGKAKQDRLLT